MNTHTCANCGNTFVAEYHGVRGCPICVGGGTMSLTDLLVDEDQMNDDAPPKYDDLQTIMRLNSEGVVTIQTPGSVTEWISSDMVAELKR